MTQTEQKTVDRILRIMEYKKNCQECREDFYVHKCIRGTNTKGQWGRWVKNPSDPNGRFTKFIADENSFG